MQPDELDVIAETIVDAVKAHTLPLAQRLDVLDARAPIVGPAGKDGKDGADAQPIDVDAIVKSAAALIPVPRDGKDGQDADIDTVVALVLEKAAGVMALSVERAVSERLDAAVDLAVTKALAAYPTPKDGKDGADGQPGAKGADAPPVDIQDVVKQVAALVPTPKDGRDGVDGKDGRDGRDVDVALVATRIDEAVKSAVAAIPPPVDGRDGAKGERGTGVAGALIDNEGRLVLTLSDGVVCPLGYVVGAKGDRGTDGVNGADGFGFDDLKVDYDGDRAFALNFIQGDRTKTFSFQLPTTIYKGVFSSEKSYERGDCVTWGGAMWIAQKQTGAKPGEGTPERTGWVLAVKKGNDGKAGAEGKEGRPGRNGADGKERW